MPRNPNLDPVVIVILGARGDLARRKLVPALYNLYLDHHLPERFSIVGVSRKAMDDDTYRQHLREAVDQFSRRGKPTEDEWNAFAANISYLSEDLSVLSGDSNALRERLEDIDRNWHKRANRVYYLAVTPELIEPAARHLEHLGVCRDCTRDRIVIEKPFGRDLASARALNGVIDSLFAESQIYRIDHYLGKETVQNILAFRFANSLFEPIWNRSYIDHVQITVAETVGVELRGEYYERAGALRDMVQNHLLQILCLVAMEPPVSFAADEVRNKKVDVLRAIRPIRQEEVHSVAVRGQYRRGEVKGRYVPGYRDEPGVAPDSLTETYAALKLYIENWRWQGVPFYLRTGKRLHTKASEVTIMFRPAPHQMFPSAAVESWQPNRMVIRIQPEEGIVTRIQVKQPGPRVLLGPAEMQFRYQEAFRSDPPEAYETLLLDVIRADATLFMRADQVESAWSVISPVLEVWDAVPPTSFPDYPAGSFGPESADLLIAKCGHSWVQPVVMLEEEGSEG